MNNNAIQKQTQRKDWVDALRALAMLFVIYGHFYRKSAGYFVFTSPIKIPLFFAVSGYLFNDKNGNIKAFLSKIFRQLLIPWLCLTLAVELLYIPFNGFGYFAKSVLQIIVGEKYWYMPCCIIAEILFMLSKKYTRNLYQLTGMSLIITVVGYVLSKFGICNIFKLDTALIVQSFLLLGFLIRKNEKKIQQCGLWLPVGSLILYVVLGVVSLIFWPGRSLDVNNNSYYNIPICVAMIILGSFALFSLVPRIRWFPRSLVYIGQNTLIFYFYHTHGRSIVSKAMQIIGFTLPDTWYVALGMTIVVCIGCGIGAALINWLLPEAIGRRRKSKVRT